MHEIILKQRCPVLYLLLFIYYYLLLVAAARPNGIYIGQGFIMPMSDISERVSNTYLFC